MKQDGSAIKTVENSDLCPEKQKLIGNYAASAREFAATVGALSLRAGLATKSEYALLGGEAASARHRCEEARNAYEAHIAEHGC